MKLCQMIGVSRSTIREALRSLQTMGYVEMRPGSGAFLLAKSPNPNYSTAWFHEHSYEILDILEVREMFEPQTAYLAAKRIKQNELITLVGIYTLFGQAVEANNVAQIAQYDEAFHNQLAVASHNSMLLDIYASVAKALMAFRNRSFTFNGGKIAMVAHERILKAIQAHDPEQAREMMLKHLHENVEFASGFLK
jgi:GntR family transcriptional repressor for pyruvate dehydrogenase complex